jgi:two-component system, chemotaxis family, chemotaxis protein CheY
VSVAHTVLVVDDDADIAESMRDVLELEGYAVMVAANGRDALAVLDAIRKPPCLILLDLLMPIMDGNELLAELARRPAMAVIPVIVISAASTIAAPDGVPVIRKPFALRALYDAVKQVCAP